MAEGLGCRFVYAIVPDGDVEEVVLRRAREKATALIAAASVQMALEDQALGEEKLRAEVERLAREIASGSSSDLWDEA